jgi:hypothetical protein
VAGDAYVFRLDGADLIPTEKVVEPPRGFADVQIDFTAQIGFTLPVVAVGAEDEVIPGVRVAAKWLDEASWTSRDASTDEHGRASLRGLPPAVIYLWASRDGFVDMGADPLELSASRVEPVLIRLSPAGTIRGRCVRGDVPVTSFELIWWKEQGTAKCRQTVRGEPDGRFTPTRMATFNPNASLATSFMISNWPRPAWISSRMVGSRSRM